MAVKFINCKAHEVRALLADPPLKTMTRRALKPQPWDGSELDQLYKDNKLNGAWFAQFWRDNKPWNAPLPYAPGDLLYVRETHVIECNYEYREHWQHPGDGRPVRTVDRGPDWGECELIPHYRATEPEPHIVHEDNEDGDDRTRWTPSIHMPRWASRITLRVTDVKIERLQDISEADALAEGVWHASAEYRDEVCTWRDAPTVLARLPAKHFAKLWNDINGPDAWESNPWVTATSFEVIKANVDQVLQEAA